MLLMVRPHWSSTKAIGQWPDLLTIIWKVQCRYPCWWFLSETIMISACSAGRSPSWSIIDKVLWAEQFLYFLIVFNNKALSSKGTLSPPFPSGLFSLGDYLRQWQWAGYLLSTWNLPSLPTLLCSDPDQHSISTLNLWVWSLCTCPVGQALTKVLTFSWNHFCSRSRFWSTRPRATAKSISPYLPTYYMRICGRRGHALMRLNKLTENRQFWPGHK
jgi:hypothetical protein